MRKREARKGVRVCKRLKINQKDVICIGRILLDLFGNNLSSVYMSEVLWHYGPLQGTRTYEHIAYLEPVACDEDEALLILATLGEQ